MQILEVTSGKLEKEFLQINATVHAGNPHYIRPLDKEVKEVFNENKNKNFKYGTAKRWVLKDDNDVTIGRIAAFTNSH